FERTDVRKAKTVTHDGIGSASPSHMHEPPALTIAYNIPGNKNIATETEFIHHLKFPFYSLLRRFIFYRVSFLQPFIGQLTKEFFIFFPAFREMLFVFRGRKIKIKMTVSEDVFGIFDDLRVMLIRFQNFGY